MTTYDFLADRADLLHEMALIDNALVAFAARHGDDAEAQELRRRLLAARRLVLQQLVTLAGPVDAYQAVH